jgi:hypothetical protein
MYCRITSHLGHCSYTMSININHRSDCHKFRPTLCLSQGLSHPEENKVKVTLERVTKAQRGSRGIALLFLYPQRKIGWVVNATSRPLYSGKETRYQLYRRLGGPQGRSGRVRKTSPQPGFDPRTVQPVASRYTDCAFPAHEENKNRLK